MAQRSTDQLRNATATFVRYCSPMAILQGQSDGSFKNRKDLRDTTSVAKRRARLTELCAIHDCEADATVMARLPAFPLNWEHPVCEQHLRNILNPRTKLQCLNNDTIAVFVGEAQLGAD